MTRGLDYPAYIQDAAPPDGCCVPPGALPHVVEGHVNDAVVATVGINPHGVWHCSDYPSMEEGGAEKLWEDKRRYFENNRYRYFTALEPILNACGASYGGRYVSSQPDLACSLDVVQWPTDPLWGKLDRRVQDRLVEDGLPFFERVLQESPNIRLLLGNGRTVVERLERTFGARFEQQADDGSLGTTLFRGELLGRRFIGWSQFLSNSPMNGCQRAELARLVGLLPPIIRPPTNRPDPQPCRCSSRP